MSEGISYNKTKLIAQPQVDNELNLPKAGASNDDWAKFLVEKLSNDEILPKLEDPDYTVGLGTQFGEGWYDFDNDLEVDLIVYYDRNISNYSKIRQARVLSVSTDLDGDDNFENDKINLISQNIFGDFSYEIDENEGIISFPLIDLDYSMQMQDGVDIVGGDTEDIPDESSAEQGVGGEDVSSNQNYGVDWLDYISNLSSNWKLPTW